MLSFADLDVPIWLYLFRAPRSYSGEDLAELHIPGNPLLARMLLQELIARGARAAEPGEFTARAYFNGRMGLEQAEGVAATIAAHNQQELAAARQLASGELARRLAPIMDEIVQALALVEVGIDFSEEDVTFISADELRGRIDRLRGAIADLIDTSARFDRLSHEPQFVLIGRPNAGKSTLLNALAGIERSIVSPIAGTTRNLLSAEVALDRGIVRLIDAAGIDDSPPPADKASPASAIARQMHEQAMRAVESADFVLLVHDLSGPEAMLVPPRRANLIILTKLDLVGWGLPHHSPDSPPQCAVSAKTGANLDTLRAHFADLAFATAATPTLALNARHLAALAEARAALDRAGDAAETGSEIVAMELRESLDSLAAILGTVTPDDVLGRVFAAFCVGK
jgi:tRNA modification GTPase